jgi:hypothetical protein
VSRAVRKFTPPNRLRKLMAEPGGVTAGRALERANGNVESIRETTMATIDEKIARITELARGDVAGRLASIYALSNEVFAESGAFGLAELSAAANSLCALLATAEQARVPDTAIVVHVESMRLLRKPELAGNPAVRRAKMSLQGRLRISPSCAAEAIKTPSSR